MRETRRVSFAAPFVMVVGTLAGCGGPKTSEAVHANPPPPEIKPGSESPPKQLTVEECKAITRGTACEPEQRCEIASGCGLNGWQCRDGKWQEMMMLCNPPPPGSGGEPGPSGN